MCNKNKSLKVIMFPFNNRQNHDNAYKSLAVEETQSQNEWEWETEELEYSRTGGMRRYRSQFMFFIVFCSIVSYIVLSVVLPVGTKLYENGLSDKPGVGPNSELRISVNGSNSSALESTTTPKLSHVEFKTEAGNGSLSEEQFGRRSANEFQSTTPSYYKKLACRVPRLNPFDQSIKHLVAEPRRVNCTDKFPAYFESTLNSTIVTVKDLKGSHVESCCYKNLVRKGSKNDPDNGYSLSDKCFPVPIEMSSVTSIPAGSEYVVISCKVNNGSTITTQVTDMFAFVQVKPLVEQRIEYYYKVRIRNQSEANNNNSKSKEEGEATNSHADTLSEEDKLNVVVLGIDAVSHMNFIRTMPKSYTYLMKHLGAIEMNGLNKVGDNTYPNLAAALTSLNKSTLESSCEVEDAFDDCPFIWKDYASHGYRTSFGEDSPWMGIFNYLKKGFRQPPTDYYLRPFTVAAENLIGSFKQLNARLCYGPRLSFEVLLDYMKKVAYTMGSDKRYFQFIWATSLTHDFLNHGKLGDNHLLSTLQWFESEGHLNRTIFILMSDHGIRWGEIHEYIQGQLEERLPFLYFATPLWFQEKYSRAYDNLKLNQNRLTTPFDLHETLLDILNLTRLDNDRVKEREFALKAVAAENTLTLPRGISQFLPIPLSRTCEMAEIEDHYCTCHNLEKLEKHSPEVGQAANFIVFQINAMVSKYPECAFLALGDIRSAYAIHSGFKFNEVKGNSSKGYELSVRTSPGNAVFEATVLKRSDGKWKISGTISRTNLYGNQSHCIQDKDLKLYCYCTDNEMQIRFK